MDKIDLLKFRMDNKGKTMGEAMRSQTYKIFDHTFSRDPNYKVGNIYDVNGNLLEENVEFKFQFSQKYTLNRDKVEHLVEFRSDFRPEVKFIREDGLERLGFYLDIPDNMGRVEKWLIAGKNDERFIRYNVLKCNWTFKYVYNKTVYSILGVLRNRNNYNSGVWSDGFTTLVQNQAQFIIPMCDDAYDIDYDLRFMIGDNKKHPIVYKVTKREDTFPLGIYKVTLSQDLYNQAKDDAELGVCDYYGAETVPSIPILPPTPEEDKVNTGARINCSGTSTILYLGGSSRTLTAYKTSESSDSNKYENPIWKFYMDNIEKTIEELVEFNVEVNNDTVTISAKEDYSMVGKRIKITINDINEEFYASEELTLRRL